MADVLKQEKEQEYQKYVKQVTPTHNLFLNMVKAFVTGGAICVLGQVILNWCQNVGMKQETAGSWCSLLLILLSVILTGTNVYQKLAKFGGAGTLVPIPDLRIRWRHQRLSIRRKVRSSELAVKFLQLQVR